MKHALILLFMTVPLFAQETLDYYIETSKPVEEHEHLKELVGGFEIEPRMWLDAAGEPKVLNGAARGKLILGGRFLALETDVRGGDLTSQGLTILGFDRRTDEYTLVGYDDLGTYYITPRASTTSRGTRS